MQPQQEEQHEDGLNRRTCTACRSAKVYGGVGDRDSGRHAINPPGGDQGILAGSPRSQAIGIGTDSCLNGTHTHTPHIRSIDR